MTPLAAQVLDHLCHERAPVAFDILVGDWADLAKYQAVQPATKAELRRAVDELAAYGRVEERGGMLCFLPEKPKDDPQRSLF